ncbi:hypothetical protein V2G26_012494 [Clonostachys chloroleuca]
MIDMLPLPGSPVVNVAVALVCITLTYQVTMCFHNYFFHPLAKCPGPKLAAISGLWYAKNWLSKRWAFTRLDASKKYGDVIRIAPNELFFTSFEAFEEIY